MTGLLDADVYGPNVPLMMGVRATPHAVGPASYSPLQLLCGVRLMSMAFLNPGDKPLVWRGPMLNSVIQQFLRNVDWGELDYLIIDLPSRLTGDVQVDVLVQTTSSDRCNHRDHAIRRFSRRCPRKPSTCSNRCANVFSALSRT